LADKPGLHVLDIKHITCDKKTFPLQGFLLLVYIVVARLTSTAFNA